jgi:hypothetical protein
MLVENLITKSWALLIWRWSTLCFYNFWEGFLLDVGTLLRGLPFSHKSISEVGHWCWAISPGLQSAFQFFPKVLDGVEVRALCRLVKFFHTEAQYHIECHCINIPSLELRGLAQTMKNSPRPLFLLNQTLQLALCIGAGSVLLVSATQSC